MRHGFTAIEMLIVLAIMVMMVGLAVPSVSESFQRSRVQNAANAIQEAHRQARQLARAEGLPNPGAAPSMQSHFGVKVTSEGAEITYGTEADPATWGDATFPFPKGVVAVSGGAAVVELHWRYQYGTGYPTAMTPLTYTMPGQLSQSINVGVPGSTISDLQVRTVDGTATGRHSAAVRIFRTGAAHVELR